MYKVIWVAGMPRAGSMWTFNVVRGLLRHAGFRVLPEEVKILDPEWTDYANREVGANGDPNTIFVLKSHAYLKSLTPSDLVITNIRDIRDVLISYMRFMHVDFGTALSVMHVPMRLADHYLGLSEQQCMILRFEQITRAPAEAAMSLGKRIGLDIDEAAALEIAAAFSKEKVKAETESRDRRCREAVKSGKQPQGEVLLQRADGVPVAIDMSTGFQSGHVSDYQDGSWREILSAEQIGVMSKMFAGWLERNGFAS